MASFIQYLKTADIFESEKYSRELPRTLVSDLFLYQYCYIKSGFLGARTSSINQRLCKQIIVY